MSDNFAFLLPVMMAIFGGAFLLAWRLGIRAGLPWGLGYLTATAGFAAPEMLAGAPGFIVGLVADTAFALAHFCYMQALLSHFHCHPARRLGLGLVLAAVTASAVATIGFGSLRFELVANDVLCSMLIGTALVFVRSRVRRPADLALCCVTALIIADNLFGSGISRFATDAGHPAGFSASAPAFFTQASGNVLGLLFGLSGLAALMLDLIADYKTEALTDPLTGLLNRRGFDAATPDLSRAPTPQGSVLTCDIDHFKRVNDRFGHAVGDRVIATVAELLKTGLPPGAVASRFGGEEFIVYLPTPDGEAQLLADGLRRAIADHAWTAAGVDLPLTASFGLAAIDPCDATLHDAIARADRSLYEAKLAGRNRVAGRRLAA